MAKNRLIEIALIINDNGEKHVLLDGHSHSLDIKKKKLKKLLKWWEENSNSGNPGDRVLETLLSVIAGALNEKAFVEALDKLEKDSDKVSEE